MTVAIEVTHRGQSQRALVLLLRCLVGVALVAGWQLLATTVPTVQEAFGTPAAVADTLWAWLRGADSAWSELAATLLTTAAGLAAGMEGAVGLLCITLHPAVARALGPFIAASNAVPKVVLFPLFIVWFGIGMTSKITFVATVVGFVVFYNLYGGLQAIDPDLRRNVQALGASRGWTLRVLIVSAVMGWLIAGLRASVAFALLATILAEYLGSNAGLGFVISQGQANLESSKVIAGVLVVGLLALGLDRAVLAIERRAQPWRRP